jgi:hypothetical protein
MATASGTVKRVAAIPSWRSEKGYDLFFPFAEKKFDECRERQHKCSPKNRCSDRVKSYLDKRGGMLKNLARLTMVSSFDSRVSG